MSDSIVKVERNVMAYWKPAKLSTQYGPTSRQALSDETRQAMGGEPKGYFFGQLKDGKWILLNRAPDQDW